MSSRLKSFALVSFIGAVAMLLSFAVFVGRMNHERFSHDHRLSNVVATNAIVSGLTIDGLMDMIHIFSNTDPETILERPVIEKLDFLIGSYIEDTPIYKVKIYTPEGMIVYSTEHTEIGQTHDFNEDFRYALAGKVHSELIRKDRYNESDRLFVERDVYETYVPVLDGKARVLSVFEMYTDVTDAIREHGKARRMTMLGITALIAFFYLALYYLFYRTDKDLARETAEREKYMARLEKLNEVLDMRVKERTMELEKSRYYLQSVLDGIADPVMVIGSDLAVVDMNAAARALIPADADPVDYQHCYQISHRQDKPCSGASHPCSFVEVMEKSATCKLLHKHVDAEGNEMFVEVTSTPLKDSDGKMLGIIEIEHDVTEVVQARDRLKESEQQIRAVMDTVGDAIITVDEKGMVIDSNKSGATLLGYEMEDLLNKHYRELLCLSALGESVDDPATFLSPMVFKGSSEMNACHNSGRFFPVELWVGLVGLQGVRNYILVFHDITERRIKEQELEQVREITFHREKMAAIGQLAAGILHEVGNPIAAISGTIQSMLAGKRQGDKQLEIEDSNEFLEKLSVVDSHVNRLAGITREIADFVSPRSESMELLDLNELVRHTANLMRYDKRFSEVELQLALDKSLPAVRGIADQIVQVLMNLLINAVDSYENVADREPKITVRTLLDSGTVHLSVMDSGAGMNIETRYHAFDVFYTTKPPGKGTGLGLALCDSVMANHGGTMELESTLGEGTTLNLYFPVPEMDV